MPVEEHHRAKISRTSSLAVWERCIASSFREPPPERGSSPFDVWHDPTHEQMREAQCDFNAVTMNTSNSSRQRNGISTTSQRANMKHTVEKDRSPPDSERVSLCTSSPRGVIYGKNRIEWSESRRVTNLEWKCSFLVIEDRFAGVISRFEERRKATAGQFRCWSEQILILLASVACSLEQFLYERR